MVLFQRVATAMIVHWVQIWRVWGPMILLNERSTVRLPPVLHDTRSVSWGAVLMEDGSLDWLRCCQWWSLQSPAVRVNLQFCVFILASNNRLFSDPPTYYWRKHPKCSKIVLVIIFPQGSAATLSRWGGNSVTGVAYYLNILCVKYCRNRSTYIDTMVN